MRPLKISLLIALGAALLSQPVVVHAQPEPAGSSPKAVDSDDDEETAQHLLERGRKAYAQRRLKQAHDAFRAAWDLRQTPGIACNLGQTEMELKKYRDAAEHLQWCMRLLPEPKPAEGLKDLAAAKAHVLTFKLTTQPDDVTVQIDGKPVGKAPLELPLFLEAGSHKLEIFREGYEPHIETFEGAAGASLEKHITLAARAPAVDAGLAASPGPTQSPPPPSDPQPPPQPDSSLKTIVLVGGGVASLGALVAGAIFRVDAGSKADTRDRLQGEAGDCFSSRSRACQELSAAQGDYESLSNTSTLFFGLGLGLAAVTVGTYLLWPDNSPSRSDTARQHARAHVRVGLTPSALLIQGDF